MQKHSELTRSFGLSRSLAKRPFGGGFALTVLALVATLGSTVSASATTNYNNSVLNACYSFLGTTEETPLNRATVGTLCFNGAGGIVGTPTNSGYVVNTNGVVVPVGPTSGNYQVQNIPGDGMGQMTVATTSGVCYGSDEFSIGKLVAGVAVGYKFNKIKHCDAADVQGGTALFQGPGGTAYTRAVLNGCYAFLATSVGTAPARNIVGTLCFDGIGNIVAVAGPPDASGSLRITNGAIQFCNGMTGTYAVTNTPGDGMGTLTFGNTCNFLSTPVVAFSINRVSGGLAGGFQFEAVSTGGVTVMGGAAEYQGP